ncbi:MAG TPA: hypothetical protein PK530_21535 [Anaerolineales bacterium]|nr:hypothetical protein [Anaerolineales bacterium]
MSTESTSRPMSRFAEKLSAFRAGLNKDEQDLLDEIVSNGDVEAHAARWIGRAPVQNGESEDVEAHAAAMPLGWGKVSASKEGEDVEAHARQLKSSVMKDEGEDVEAHARAMPKAAARSVFKFNAARASYEIEGEEDVEAHLARYPRATEARMPAVTR